jgi:hypothetical protein
MRLDLVGAPLLRVGMDLQGPFPVSKKGNRYILVVQDYFSKFVEMYAIPDKCAITVADILVTEYFARYGVCERLHSDQGMEFDAAVTHEVCRMWGVKKTRTSPFAPWSNGMVERSNKSIKQLLRQMCHQKHRHDWDLKLPYVRMALNTTVHSTTGYTPHLLFFSRCEEAVLPCDLIYGKTDKSQPHCLREYVFEQKISVQEIAEMARQHTGKQASIQKANRDRSGLKIRKYLVGDMVWRHSVPNRADKLHPHHYVGPYRVLDVDEDFNDVLLELPGVGGSWVRKWVNVSNVKPAIYTKDGYMLLLDSEVIW